MADFKISTCFLTQFVNLTGNRLKIIIHFANDEEI